MLLIVKLQAYGSTANLLKLIMNYLRKRYQHTKVIGSFVTVYTLEGYRLLAPPSMIRKTKKEAGMYW